MRGEDNGPSVMSTQVVLEMSRKHRDCQLPLIPHGRVSLLRYKATEIGVDLEDYLFNLSNLGQGSGVVARGV